MYVDIVDFYVLLSVLALVDIMLACHDGNTAPWDAVSGGQHPPLANYGATTKMSRVDLQRDLMGKFASGGFPTTDYAEFRIFALLGNTWNMFFFYD